MDTYFVPSGEGLGNAAVVALLEPEQQPLAAAMARQDCASELRIERLRVAELERQLEGFLCGAARSRVLSELRRRRDRCDRLAENTMDTITDIVFAPDAW